MTRILISTSPASREGRHSARGESFGGDLVQLTALNLERDKTPLISSESVLSQSHRSSCNLIPVLVRTTLDDIRQVQSRSHKERLISAQFAEADVCIALDRISV